MSDAPPPPSEPFDATFWKAVNAALDEALECDDLSRPNFIKTLHARDPRLANEVRDLHEGLGMVEEMARQDLGMVRPNEIFVQIAHKKP